MKNLLKFALATAMLLPTISLASQPNLDSQGFSPAPLLIEQKDQSHQNQHQDFWIYDADIELITDRDNDHFYHRFELTFDADTTFYWADVLARVYVADSHSGFSLEATSDVFTIEGESSHDSYSLSFTWYDGYPTDYYDFSIELYDYHTGYLVATLEPYQDRDLERVPLEDSGHDNRSSYVIGHHAGSFGIVSSFALMIAALLRRKWKMKA